MERDSLQRYAESLEKTIQSNHHYLKENVKNFQEMCLMVTPERNVPPEIVLDIRQLYKEIRTTPPREIPAVLPPGCNAR